jgi:hypothetical protein
MCATIKREIEKKRYIELEYNFSKNETLKQSKSKCIYILNKHLKISTK